MVPGASIERLDLPDRSGVPYRMAAPRSCAGLPATALSPCALEAPDVAALSATAVQGWRAAGSLAETTRLRAGDAVDFVPLSPTRDRQFKRDLPLHVWFVLDHDDPKMFTRSQTSIREVLWQPRCSLGSHAMEYLHKVQLPMELLCSDYDGSPMVGLAYNDQLQHLTVRADTVQPPPRALFRLVWTDSPTAPREVAPPPYVFFVFQGEQHGSTRQMAWIPDCTLADHVAAYLRAAGLPQTLLQAAAGTPTLGLVYEGRRLNLSSPAGWVHPPPAPESLFRIVWTDVLRGGGPKLDPWQAYMKDPWSARRKESVGGVAEPAYRSPRL